jgi:hypothetical protein
MVWTVFASVAGLPFNFRCAEDNALVVALLVQCTHVQVAPLVTSDDTVSELYIFFFCASFCIFRIEAHNQGI